MRYNITGSIGVFLQFKALPGAAVPPFYITTSANYLKILHENFARWMPHWNPKSALLTNSLQFQSKVLPPLPLNPYPTVTLTGHHHNTLCIIALL